MKTKNLLAAALCAVMLHVFSPASSVAASLSIDWRQFLSRHDLCWTALTSDPVQPSSDGGQRTGYYAGAIMGNGLLGTNLYKLHDGVYRLNVGRSDVTEVRKPYNLYNSARLPIGYFTLSTVGRVTDEAMHLSLYDAVTTGCLTTDRGSIRFTTYVHALADYIVFETETDGAEADYRWDFVAQEAVSPRHIINPRITPADYLNHLGHANPAPERLDEDGCHLLVQPLVTDSSMTQVGGAYVVAWREQRKGRHRRIVATVARAATVEAAKAEARRTIADAFARSGRKLTATHRAWWNDFYRRAAFLTFPDTRTEAFYWIQYYKFASTTRPGKPIADLQGVWPTWDTPWTAVWINLNLQLTYSWQTKANLGWLAEPLWESLYAHRDNLRRNVTDIPGQETWTDAACLGRTSSYDFLSPLNPALAATNQYEVGNLTWLLSYYWQYCMAYGDTVQLTERFYPLLKAAVNLFFHIRVEKDGCYALPPTASPEYIGSNIGTNANYDLANLRWGLRTLIDVAEKYVPGEPLLPAWRDFLARLVPYRYDEATGFRVSDAYAFEHTDHRHYSHLFMIYPYYMVNWENEGDREAIRLSVGRWRGNQGYSRTGKAAMLLSMGDGDGALAEMQKFLDRFVKPNTLYAETGPVIETPLAAVSTLHDFYLQDWGERIRVFHAMPAAWRDAAFAGMRARGAFLVSAVRRDAKTVYIKVESEKGGPCRLQTGVPAAYMEVRAANGKPLAFETEDATAGIIVVATQAGDAFTVTDKRYETALPAPLPHPESEYNLYGDGSRLKR